MGLVCVCAYVHACPDAHLNKPSYCQIATVAIFSGYFGKNQLSRIVQIQHVQKTMQFIFQTSFENN